MQSRIDIGIDGGGTGCRLAISLNGAQAREFSGGPANFVSDPDAALGVITQLRERALTELGVLRADWANARVCCGLAGARLPGEADRFKARLPFPACVLDDSRTALEGAFDGGDGTLASLGTGSFFIRKAGGTVHHIGGWGFHLGDEGSAAWAGRRALSLALRVVDGRLPPDPLADTLIAACPTHPSVFARDAQPSEFAALVPLLLEHPDSALGQHVLAEVMSAVEGGIGDIGHSSGTPLVLAGGFGTALRAHLGDAFRGDLVDPRGRPLDGALRLARGLP